MRAFTLHTPVSLDSALALAEKGARPLAGGQDLLTELKEHLVEPSALVNLKHLSELRALEVAGDDADGPRALKIGALVTITELEEHAGVRARWRALSEAAASIASAQIRNVGTVGGNLCQRPRCPYYRLEHAKCLKKGGTECFSEAGSNKYNAIFGGGPSYIVHPSDLAPALVAFEAEIGLQRAGGARRMALESFFTLPAEGDVQRENVLKPGELVVELKVPSPGASTRSTYLKFKERGSFDWALSSVAIVLAFDGPKIQRARVVLGGVAPRPWRAKAAEAVLEGGTLEAATITRAAQAAVQGAEPLAENGYKVPLTRALVARALRALANQAG